MGQAFEQEKPCLLALPANPYPVEKRVVVAVGKTPYAHIIWFALVCCQFIPRMRHAVQAQLFEFSADITTHG